MCLLKARLGLVPVSGLESNNVTVTFINSLTGTAFDPGYNNLYVTLGVTYASGSSTTRKVPTSVLGGSLFDSVSSKNLPVFGVSEYQVQSSQPAAESCGRRRKSHDRWNALCLGLMRTAVATCPSQTQACARPSAR